MLVVMVLAFLAGCATAQASTTSAETKVATMSSATYPIISIFLPFKAPDSLGASIVTAVRSNNQ